MQLRTVYLGNIRMLLTEEEKINNFPAATMEPGSIATESAWYENLTSTQNDRPSWFSDNRKYYLDPRPIVTSKNIKKSEVYEGFFYGGKYYG